MHFISSIASLLLATLTTAEFVTFKPSAGKDCAGGDDSLPHDSSGGDRPLHYCFDISDAESFRWHFDGKTATDHDFAKWTYYSETGCSGDVTAVKVLCGVSGEHEGTCYNKHDANAGSVFVETQGNKGCDFWDEGEKECNNTQTSRLGKTASAPPCGTANFPGTG
ncbi:hypothetical protein Q7P37_009375 [Cladosporium fusiforme]